MQRNRAISSLKLGMVVIIALLSLVTRQANAGNIAVAEALLVDLRAEDLASGSVSEWPNRGALGGVFTAVGSPVVMDVGGWESVSLDGDSYLEGPRTVPGIEGGDPRSVEIWAYKIGLAGEQTMLSWGHRGGPDGTNFGFNYADNTSWGAVGHWGGGPDMGWGGNHAPTPALESWWHLVYTYDGATTRLYVNGEPAGEEDMTLNTHAGAIIRVGAQGDATGEAADTAMNFIGGIAQVRVHDGVLTPAQVQANSLIRIQSSNTASSPSPGDGDTDVLRDAALSWNPGETAATRNLYVGTTFEDVNGATVPTATGLTETTFDPGRLDFDQVYYWRVDEVNGTPDKTVFKGDVWSFMAEPYSVQVPGDTIVASASTSMAASGPENTIDGSGLDPNTGQHSTTNVDMWFSLAADMSPWLQYEFEDIKQLDKMLLWNSNSTAESAIGWGLKDVVIEYSADGVEWTVLEGADQLSRAPGLPTYAEPDEVVFGDVSAKAVKITILSNHGGVLPAYGVSEVQFFAVPVKARTPDPADQAVDVMPNVLASWRAGREAGTHRVWVSEDANAISDGVSAVSNTNSIDMSILGLELGKTYYWQVVEVNENNVPSEWASDVWRMGTVNRVMVDDFESYGNLSPDRPFQTWLDGIGYSSDEHYLVGYPGNDTGAAVGHDIWSLSSPHYDGDIMEQVLTAEGSGQSLPVYYGGNSKTDRVFETAQDWSIAGINTLVLFFNGGRANDAGSLYVTINNTRVDYPEASALTSGIWTQWNIDLMSQGINLSQVTTLTIGIESAGSGVVYVDQISLYSDAPEPAVSSDPGTANLAASYSFENDYTDGSGHGLAGTPMGLPTFVSGLAGNGTAISLNGADDYIELPIGSLMSTLTDCTFAIWADFSGEGGNWQRLIDFGSGTSQYFLISPRSGGGVLLMEMNGPDA
ncbi:MAG: hypothetical protein GY809_23740, partial [Planctomycetes bacterium]|nr:hypothetical protein [Planctomycetota bacterium]